MSWLVEQSQLVPAALRFTSMHAHVLACWAVPISAGNLVLYFNARAHVLACGQAQLVPATLQFTSTRAHAWACGQSQ